jgi:uncharacterized damage-inducible protein DinB
VSKLEIIRALYEYNEWANNHILEAAARLSDAEFSRRQGASFDSVEGNLAHIAGGQVIWLERWMGGSNARPVLDFQKTRGLAAIRELFTRSHTELREFLIDLTDERLNQLLAYRDSAGNAYERRLWQLMVHVANHGTHHRAETAMALGLLGHPMRELDYSFFEIERSRETGARL